MKHWFWLSWFKPKGTESDTRAERPIVRCCVCGRIRLGGYWYSSTRAIQGRCTHTYCSDCLSIVPGGTDYWDSDKQKKRLAS